MLAAVGVGLCVYCGRNRSVNHCKILHDFVESTYPVLDSVREKATVFAGEVASFASEWFVVFKVEFSKTLDRFYAYYNDWTKS